MVSQYSTKQKLRIYNVHLIAPSLQVSSGLIQRVVATDRKFERHLEAEPKIAADFEYAIEKRAAAEAIENIRLVHLRGERDSAIPSRVTVFQCHRCWYFTEIQIFIK